MRAFKLIMVVLVMGLDKRNEEEKRLIHIPSIQIFQCPVGEYIYAIPAFWELTLIAITVKHIAIVTM